MPFDGFGEPAGTTLTVASISPATSSHTMASTTASNETITNRGFSLKKEKNLFINKLLLVD
jgi:hypothetical protein